MPTHWLYCRLPTLFSYASGTASVVLGERLLKLRKLKEMRIGEGGSGRTAARRDKRVRQVARVSVCVCLYVLLQPYERGGSGSSVWFDAKVARASLASSCHSLCSVPR